MSGAELPDLSESIVKETPLIPFEARQALHNMPSFYNKDVAIDLVEYRGLDHVGIRVYQGQLDGMAVEDRIKVYQKVTLMVEILRGYGVSASIEKAPGNPPPYVKR